MLDAIKSYAKEIHSPYKTIVNYEELLNETQRIAGLGSWKYDLVRNALVCSEEAFRIFGVSTEKKNPTYEEFIESVHPEDREKVLAILQQSLDSGPDHSEIEYRIVRPMTGEVRFIRQKSQRLRTPQGRLILSKGTVQDITVEVEATNKIRESEARLSAFLRTSSDGITIINRDGLVIESSDSFLIERGFERSCLGNLKVGDWDSQFSDEQIKAQINKVLEANEVVTFETQHDDAVGNKFWVEVKARGLEILGEKLLFSTHRNITQQKLAEEERDRLQMQLVQSQKMEAIGHLTGGIAHDFNNMLGIIMGFTELLQKLELNENISEKFNKYTDAIRITGNRAKELISQMLIFSRLSFNQTDEASYLLLETGLKEIVQLLRSSIPSTIDLELDIKNKSLAVVFQSVQLHQIILNLVLNAKDAIAEHGYIRISAQKKSVNAICSSCLQSINTHFVEIKVADNGSGIPKSIINNIFEPFFTTKGLGKGSGMGLSVIHGMVHAANGHVLVESIENKGSCISILLPAVEEKVNSMETPSVETESRLEGKILNGIAILLVDDEKALLTMIHELLSMHGANVSAYTSSISALEDFKQDPDKFDIVITDETMPELSGMAMASTIMDIRPKIPVILCTGFSEHVNKEIAEKQGIAAFMIKPVKMDELLGQINLFVVKSQN